MVQELGFCAAVLPSHGLPNHLGSEMFYPVYEAAQELDVALSFHGGVHDGFGFDDFNVFAASTRSASRSACSSRCAGLVFNGVYERFPGIAHGLPRGRRRVDPDGRRALLRSPTPPSAR